MESVCHLKIVGGLDMQNGMGTGVDELAQLRNDYSAIIVSRIVSNHQCVMIIAESMESMRGYMSCQDVIDCCSLVGIDLRQIEEEHDIHWKDLRSKIHETFQIEMADQI